MDLIGNDNLQIASNYNLMQQFLAGIIFSSLGISPSTSEFHHPFAKLLYDEFVKDTFVLSLVANPKKRSDESPCSQTLNFTNALECCTLIFCAHQRFRLIQVPKFGLILGDSAQEKDILVQGKVHVPYKYIYTHVLRLRCW